MKRTLPQAFGQYLLERRLGVGGMAETFVARDLSSDDDTRFCIKRVLPVFNEDESFRTQFQREARLAMRLQHPNIVGTYGSGSVDEVQYMTLELVEGVDLRRLIISQPEQRVPTNLIVMVVMDITRALQYAHEPREGIGSIVHRDVTPSNVLLSLEGAVKLADFGVAKSLGTATSATATGIMKGKMPYMPPEQMKGGDIDGRVDLFSVGVMFFEALAGRRPFVGAHDVEVMTRILGGKRPSLLEVAPHVPVGLADVVESLLSIDPTYRTATAGDLLEALEPFAPDPATRITLAESIKAAYIRKHGALPGAPPNIPYEGAVATAVSSNEAVPPPPSPKPSQSGYSPKTMVMAQPSVVETTSPEKPPPVATGAQGRKLFAVFAFALLLGGGSIVFLWPNSTEDPVVVALPRQEPTAVAHMGHEPAQHGAAQPSEPSPLDEGMETPEPVEPAVHVQAPENSQMSRVEMAARMNMDRAPRAGHMAAQTEPTEMEESATTEASTTEASIMAGDSESMTSMMTPARVNVNIVVLPWGNVWVDGRYMGRAPVDVALPPGNHRIAGGQNDGPEMQRHVRIRAGRRSQHISLDLTSSPE